MNRVVLVGRLTRDPEVKHAQNSEGTAICKFSLAVNRRSKDDQTDFINIVAFGSLGEVCGKYLSKGRQTAVEGRIQTRTYENKEGKKVTAFEVVADNIDFIGSRQDSEQQPKESFEPVTDISYEDLPF